MSFRKFGGLKYSGTSTIISTNFTSSNDLSVINNIGQGFSSNFSGINLTGKLYISTNQGEISFDNGLNIKNSDINNVGQLTGTSGIFNNLKVNTRLQLPDPSGVVQSSRYYINISEARLPPIFTTSIDVSGTIRAQVFNAISDYRVKENIQSLDENFIVDNLNPVTYNNTLTNRKDIGLIAHELQEVYPYLVNGSKDGKELQNINYIGLIGLLIKEIKQLKKRVKVLEESAIS